jgi:hypothetical protein
MLVKCIAILYKTFHDISSNVFITPNIVHTGERQNRLQLLTYLPFWDTKQRHYHHCHPQLYHPFIFMPWSILWYSSWIFAPLNKRPLRLPKTRRKNFPFTWNIFPYDRISVLYRCENPKTSPQPLFWSIFLHSESSTKQ